jgi:hypothetical protein
MESLDMHLEVRVKVPPPSLVECPHDLRQVLAFPEEIHDGKAHRKVQRLPGPPALRTREEPVIAGELPVLVPGGLEGDVEGPLALYEADDDRIIALQWWHGALGRVQRTTTPLLIAGDDAGFSLIGPG